MNFFAIFFGIFLPGSSMNGMWEEHFFLAISAYLIPFWVKIMLARGFLIFWIFLIFFSEFSCPALVGWNSELKFFYHFLGLSQPILDRNNAGIMFFHFLNFFHNFRAQVEYERNSRLNFFSLFLDLSHPVLAKNNAGKRFFSFLNFFAIFFGIFFPGSSMNGIRD